MCERPRCAWESGEGRGHSRLRSASTALGDITTTTPKPPAGANTDAGAAGGRLRATARPFHSSPVLHVSLKPEVTQRGGAPALPGAPCQLSGDTWNAGWNDHQWGPRWGEASPASGGAGLSPGGAGRDHDGWIDPLISFGRMRTSCLSRGLHRSRGRGQGPTLAEVSTLCSGVVWPGPRPRPPRAPVCSSVEWT